MLDIRLKNRICERYGKLHMKKKLRLTNGTKAFLLALEEISVVIMCICVVLGALFIEEKGYSGQLFSTNLKYEDSAGFTNLVETETEQAVRYVMLRNNFERNGSYDGTKIVDIAEYDEDGVISGKQAISVGYYLEDLIKWSQIGLNYSYLDNNQDGASNLIAGQRIDLEEEFYPARGRHLFDYRSQKMNDTVLLSHLENTLNKIGDEYQEYKELLSTYSEKKTNFRFYIRDYGNKTTYTNVNEEKFIPNDTIKYYGKYMILDSVNLEYESNMSVTESELYNQLGNYASDFSGDYYIEVGVDTSYPAVDRITQGKENYDQFLPAIQTIFYGFIVFSVIALGLLLFLTIQSGYKRESPDQITMIGFDKLKTEIAAAGLIVIGMLILGTSYSVIYSYHNSRLAVGIISGIAGLILNSFFLFGYFSLVRRIKAATVWSNSLCAWLFEKCVEIAKAGKTIFNSRKVATRTILVVSGFLTINWFFVAESVYAGSIINVFSFTIFVFDLFICVYLINRAIGTNKILQGVKKITGGELDYNIATEKMSGEVLEMAEAINHMGEGLHRAVAESIKNERLKADLITNVSHDIKTPLTSIINYVDLLKREDISDEKIRNYIEVLENKSQRLKHLTEDLVEASKISSGNIELHIERINFIELIHQTAGEFCEKFETRGLTLISNLPDASVAIAADGRRLYRVLENIYNNVAKYAMENTRVYADLEIIDGMAVFSLKNISSQALNIHADELTERFIRGDVSRSTEGSGLGLSIAKTLTEAQKGNFTIYLDGDLFKVVISFKKLS